MSEKNDLPSEMIEAGAKACPFCGSAPVVQFACESGSKDIWEVECGVCNYSLEGPREDAAKAKLAAIAAWNTRAHDLLLRQLVEALTSLLAEYAHLDPLTGNEARAALLAAQQAGVTTK